MFIRLFSLLLICFSFSCLTAQICDGNLGDNIFEDGDFGSGAATVLPNNPGIAPGYTYTTATPPNDGFYTITNNMNNWPFVWNTWLQVSDNST
ncbi:MAG: hypothetical protein AAF798_13180, partial [Bacteroidota bacterium]